MAEPASAGLVALTDQQDAAVAATAAVLGAYYGGLLRAGIPEQHAGELVHAYAETYWGLVWHRCCPCQMAPSAFD